MIVKTYDELKFYIEMFKNGNADLLVLESLGGQGKSKLVEQMMQETPHLKILAHVTPMQLFILGYKFKDKHIVIDDVDNLLHNDQNVSLLKMFCETAEFKKIGWLSTYKMLKEEGVPLIYETKSKVVILTNNFNILTKKVGALRDRGWFIQFRPTDKELLKKIEEIKNNYDNGVSMKEKQKVYDLIEKYSKFCNFSLRTFVKGLMLYKECNDGKNLDWESKLLNEMGIKEKLVLIDKILLEYEKEEERIEKWEEQGFSKRSYYDYKLKLMHKCS